jgi:hypothetical protein
MKIVSALVGLVALGGVAFSTGTASAMPVAIPAQASQTSDVQQVALVCNEWGHCWHRPSFGYGYGYYHPHYWHPHYYGGWGYGGGYRWHPHYDGGWGGYGGGWHHWHRHYGGGWGYGGGYRWHHWHHWNGW